MRIVYGRDYYDNALAFGRDESIVLVREKERSLTDDELVGHHTIQSPDVGLSFRKQGKVGMPYLRGGFFDIKGKTYGCHQITVIFCGRVYHGMQIETAEYKNDGWGTHSHMSSIFYWHIDHFNAWMDQLGIDLVELYHRGRLDPKVLFASYDASRVLLDFLIEQRIVVAIRRSSVNMFEPAKNWPRWSINSDQLKAVQFYKVVDPYAAFQEISMWIGGVLPASGAKMVEVSDIVRIEKHGFDKKTSFRNMKRND